MRRALGVERAEVGDARWWGPGAPVPGQRQLVAVDLGGGHDPIDGGAALAVLAGAAVEGHAAAEVPGHAAEAERAELAVDLAPGPLGADAGDVAVAAELGRVLGGVERAGAALRRCDRRDGRPRPGESGVEPMIGVVEDVDLAVDPHLVGDVDGRLEAQAHVAAAQVVVAAGRVSWRRALERQREGRAGDGDDVAVARRRVIAGVALAQVQLVEEVACAGGSSRRARRCG